MAQIENAADAGATGHSQDYFSGIAGFPSKKLQEHPLTLITARQDTTDQRVISDGEEILPLQRLLQEKDQALFRATLSSTDLQRRLEQATLETENLRVELSEAQRPAEALARSTGLSLETQQEVNRQRKEWLRSQKTLEGDHAQCKAELVQLRGNSYKLQQQLELESRARRMEAAQSSAKICSLERSLSAANIELSKAYAAAGKSKARPRVGVAFASVTAIMVAAVVWTQMPTAASAPVAPVARKEPVPLTTPYFQTGAGFQNSLGRLNEALSSFGNRSPEEILRDVRLRGADHSVCAFQWNNGQPALLYGGEGVNQS
ncbi:MAG: hypothetical protein QOJ99_1530, partial [Bryobacterales bacterium]|nr:hypothetical protein [Bryobacterales bacterium]